MKLTLDDSKFAHSHILRPKHFVFTIHPRTSHITVLNKIEESEMTNYSFKVGWKTMRKCERFDGEQEIKVNKLVNPNFFHSNAQVIVNIYFLKIM